MSTVLTNLHEARTAREEARLVQNKSMLARLLAAENITIIHDPKAVTAGFELEKRLLILPVWENVSADLYDLLVGHEVGHALYTRMGDWIGTMETLAKKHYGKSYKKAMPFVKNILNILEDPRIERQMKRRYPGLRASFSSGYMMLWERDFFKVKALIEATPHDEAQASVLAFMDRVNIHTKAGARIGVYFSQEEAPFVARVEALETWPELVQLADDIIQFLRDKAKGNKEQGGQGAESENSDGKKSDKKKKPSSKKSKEKSEDADGEGDEASDGEGDGKGEKSESETAEAESAEGEGEDGEGEAGDEETDSDAEGDTETHSSPTDQIVRDGSEQEGKSSDKVDVADITEQQIASELGEGLTDKAFQEAAKTLAQTGIEWCRVTAPTLVYEHFVHDFKRVMADHAKDIEFLLANSGGGHISRHRNAPTYAKTVEMATKWVNTFRAAEKKNIAYMIKEFDLYKAAASHAREQSGKTGRLDMGKLHSYQYNDDVFRRSLIQHKGQSHGIVFILDFSGSMTYTIVDVVQSLISMSMFCRQANIPFDVYIFTDDLQPGGGANANYNFRTEQAKALQSGRDGSDILIDGFWLRNLLSSRMSLREFNQALINIRLLAMGKLMSDRMGGTPLLGSIYLARDVVAKFKEMHKLDVVTLMVMTDGDSNPVTGTADGSLTKIMGAYTPNGGYLVWHDKKSKRDRAEKMKTLDQRSVTVALQKLFMKDIKETSNANVIGYYICPFSGCAGKYANGPTEYAATMAAYTEKGWAGVTVPGYDEFYMVGRSVLVSNQNRFQSMTGDAAEDFKKFTAVKNNSRTILKSIVQRICKQGV
jgi:Mg-chelatase subunit ChlD